VVPILGLGNLFGTEERGRVGFALYILYAEL
jgi:hypothetical protein